MLIYCCCHGGATKTTTPVTYSNCRESFTSAGVKLNCSSFTSKGKIKNYHHRHHCRPRCASITMMYPNWNKKKKKKVKVWRSASVGVKKLFHSILGRNLHLRFHQTTSISLTPRLLWTVMAQMQFDYTPVRYDHSKLMSVHSRGMEPSSWCC